MRYAFIKALTEEAKKNRNIVLLTGDLGFTVFEDFRDKFPNRFINVGVAEQNMVGLATGLALTGNVVFAYSIATFASMRPFEQIRNDIAAHNASVVVVGTGAGLSYGNASITHHAQEDIALMRAIPNMTVLCPADPLEAEWATREAIRLKRPVYLRLGKKGEPTLYKHTPNLKIGKGSMLKKGKDIAILSTGNIVANALAASELLLQKKIDATVISMHTVKPIDSKLIKNLSQNHKLIVTVEEHIISGGLGSAIAEIVAEQKQNCRVVRIGIPDQFILAIGSQEYLRNKLGLSPEKIAQKIYNYCND